MAGFQISTRDLLLFENAIRRNPESIRVETGKFLARGMAAYNRYVIRNPWRKGMSGGGAPVASGNLRDTHLREIGAFEARIRPDTDGRAPYAAYVHGIDGYPRKRSYQLRPWLDYTFRAADREIQDLEKDLLQSVVANLAR